MRAISLFTLSLFFIFYHGFSQVDLGFYYLPQKTTISNSISDKDDDIYQNKTTFAGGGGISFTYWINKQIGLQTGLMYISHNQKFVSKLFVRDSMGGPGSTKEVKGKKRLDYLKVPLLLTYKYNVSRKFGVFMFAGPQFAYLLKGDGAIIIYQQYDDGQSDFYDLPPSSSDYYNKFLIDVALGGTLNFRLSSELSVNTGLRFDWSISDVENKDATTAYGSEERPTYLFGDADRKKAHNSSIGILLGITYTFCGKNSLISPGGK
ncbi:MAG: PorT family protein [Cytophagaceae bacterium]|nr:PorT family protein [Cytophagaceae bacterium]